MSKSNEELKELALDYLIKCQSDMQTLQLDRSTIHSEYMGEPYGNEIKGRSQVVASDISDTIEWIMPAMMKIFYGGKDVVNLSPQSDNDVEASKMMEAKVNFDFQKGVNGFTILYDWFKDAMMFKLGVVKYWWEKREEYKEKEYASLPEEAVMALKASPDFIIDKIWYEEVLTVDIQPDPYTGVPVEVPVYTRVYYIKGREVKKISKPCIQNVPPEEFIFNVKDRYIGETFCAHRKSIHKSEAVKYGLTEDDLVAEATNFTADNLYRERFKDLGGIQFINGTGDKDFYFIYECYVWEYDKKGDKKSKIVTVVGNRVVKVEDNSYGKPPFCDLTPIRVQHRAVGRAIAELVRDFQKIKTSLTRYVLDNLYFQNNGMKVVNPYRINIDDLLYNNHPGGIVKTRQDIDPSAGIFPVPVTPLPNFTMQIFEMVDGMKENRTGVTRYNQGIDASSLNKTASGITQIMSASQQRVELIARMFAETGVKDLFQAIINMNLDYFDQVQMVRVNEQWVAIDPTKIDGSFDITIEVGIGMGAKDQQFNQMMNMLNVYAIAMNTGAFQMTPDKMNAMLKEMWSLIGFKNPERFLPEPGNMPIPPGSMGEIGNIAQKPTSGRNMDMSQGGMLGLQ